ncbi:DsbA family protein [Pseudoxanthomonas sp.]|uniref:DsbA family protein n=1 Tax=unclassified Pseudoxanthomonas TaxID=2645906 RepID=UPI002E0FE58B|nr:thioredoxin domain-containing protein [Pseudoxanthomonas sp.]
MTATVTIVEFFDPTCESCRAMYPHVKQLLAARPKDVRLVIRYVPFHGQVSKEAIGVLEAARKQKKFEPVLETLMQNQPVWASHGAPDPKKVWEFAVAAGLDRASAQRDLATGAVETLIKREVAAVEAADIRGTPAIFVNGKLLSELGPQQLSALITSELQHTRKKPESPAAWRLEAASHAISIRAPVVAPIRTWRRPAPVATVPTMPRGPGSPR